MDKDLLLQKLLNFCPDWIERPDPSLDKIGMLQFILDQVLAGTLGIRIERLDTEKITGSVPYSHQTANVVGYMHGGTIFTTGDTLAGTFIWANTDANTFAITTRSEIKYIKPLKEGMLQCTVTEKSREGRKIELEAIFTNEDGQAMAIMSVDYLLMGSA
jgi:uncharacterized protein (TIGR00369 family)